ncbi:hypothetical protein BN1723_013540 [Verticillium longisporum]|uniref:rRNA methyltransferase 2, mitochondrial n=1 Tax=Verticillium longisporum TaxID=100787 RepID=A0A0G4LT96_VERLO|nr:hypothetical protein BN1723_013540 [Verticillium longisporum]
MPVSTRLLDAEQRQQRIHEHTMAHQSQLHQSELVVNDEKTRRLRVRKQLLADDNDALKQRLKVCGSQITQLSGQLEQAQSEVKAAKQAYRQLKKALDTQAREASHLKMELESLNNAAQDSTKVLAEKLALSREIAQLKPELEHLRSQLAHQQTVLAEKLSLERQLNSAEVELAAERRARLQSAEKHELERADGDETKQKLKYFETRLAVETRESERLRQELASAQDDSRSREKRTAADAELQAKVKELEKLLTTGKNEAKRAKKEAEVALSELQAQNENLESRVDSLKTKLRSTQSELKGSKAELEAMREAHATNLKGASRAPGPDHHATKKRRAVDLGAEDITTEATNDGDWKSRRPAKKRGLDQTLLGEKSTFSITPFLNRTKGVNVDASVDEDAEEDEADVSHIPHAETVRRAEAEAVDAVKDVERALVSATSGAEGKQGKARGRPKKALASTSPNIPPRAVARPDKMKKAARNVAVLTQVTEESTEVEAPAAGTVSAAHDVSDPSLDASVENGAVKPAVRVLEKKKKRKLVGDSSKTIFDEEEAEPVDLPVKRSNQIKLGPGKILKNPKLGMARKAFAGAAFSPLKKYRRGLDSKYRIFKKDQVVVDLVANGTSGVSAYLDELIPAPVADTDPEAFLSAGGIPCVRSPSGSQIPGNVKDASLKRDVTFIKSHYSAFKSGQLIHLLRGKFITHIFIAGSLMNIGVFATALDAAMYGYDITIVEDCCGYRSQVRQGNAIQSVIDVTGCEVDSSSTVLEQLRAEPPSAKPAVASPATSSSSGTTANKKVGGLAGARTPPIPGRVRGKASTSDLHEKLAALKIGSTPGGRIEPDSDPNSLALEVDPDAQPSLHDLNSPRRKPSSADDRDPILELEAIRNKYRTSKDTRTDTSQARKLKQPRLANMAAQNKPGPVVPARVGKDLEPKIIEPEVTVPATAPSDSVSKDDHDPATAETSPETSEPLCEGDTVIIHNVLPPNLLEGVFERLKDEVGVSTIQGDFLSPAVQGMVKDFLVRAQRRRRPDKKPTVSAAQPGDQSHGEVESLGDEPALNTVVEDKPSYIDLERAETADPTTAEEASKSLKLVNVVLSDMSAPWDQTSGFGVNTLSNPYNRMMNTSGVTFKDHVGSMDLCYAALQFASDTLKPGGHFVCKFYQGAEDKELEKQLRKLFAKVFRDKPESSRKDSKEGYFVGLNRKATVHLGDSSDEPST